MVFDIEELRKQFAVEKTAQGERIIIPILKFNADWDQELLDAGYECHAEGNKVIVTPFNPGARGEPWPKEETDRLIELWNRKDLTVDEIAKKFPNRKGSSVKNKLRRLQDAGKIEPRWKKGEGKRRKGKKEEKGERERALKQLEKATSICARLQREFEMLSAFDKHVDAFHSEFMRVAPFGRAGSEKEFRELVETFLKFRERWSKWLSGKKDKMLHEVLNVTLGRTEVVSPEEVIKGETE